MRIGDTAARGLPITRRGNSILPRTTRSREAGDTPLPPEMQAWRVRAALRALAWDDVLAAIDAMGESQRQESAWRYWRGRAMAAKGRVEEANALFETLATETNFYGVLAAEALGRQFAPPKSEPLLSTTEALNAFGARPAVQRVVKLAHLDLKAESQREWLFVVRGQPDDVLLLAADYARRVALYDRAVNTADRTKARHDYALRYLAPFRSEFDAASQQPRHRCRAAVRHRAAGVAVLPGHRVLGRRGRPDAADARHRAVGRPPTGAEGLSPRDDSGHRNEHAIRRVLLQVLARAARWHAGAGSRCV